MESVYSADQGRHQHNGGCAAQSMPTLDAVQY